MANKLRAAAARAKTKAQISNALSAILDDDAAKSDRLEGTGDGTKAQLLEIALDKLYPNEDQPRKVMAPEGLTQLANSIKRQGLLQPILVGPADSANRRMIIAGERRFRAMRQLGRDTITAMEYLPGDQTDREDPEQFTGLMAELALVENLERRDLSVIETAMAYHNMITYHGHTQSSLARALGISRHDIVRHIKVLNLPNHLQEQVMAHGISKTAAYLLAEFDRIEDAERALDLLIKGEISTMALRKKVQQANVTDQDQSTPAPVTKPFDFQKTFRTIEHSVTAMVDSRDQLSPAQRDQLRALRDQLDHMLSEEGG